MGRGRQHDDENPPSDEEPAEAEKQKLRNPEEGEVVELKKIPVKVKDVEYPVIIGTKQPFIKTSTLKYALLFFNFIIAALGLVLLCLAIWIRADPEFWQYETTLHIEKYYSVCYMFMVAGLVILVIAFLGCCGVVTESQGVLTAYVVVFALVFAIELAGVVMIWSVPYNKSMKQQLQIRLLEQVKNRENDDSSRYFTDFLQAKLQCCGSDTHKEYTNQAPNSCLDPNTGSIYHEGCASKLLLYLREKAGIIAGVALPILLFQIAALFSAGCLIRNIKKESSYVM